MNHTQSDSTNSSPYVNYPEIYPMNEDQTELQSMEVRSSILRKNYGNPYVTFDFLPNISIKVSEMWIIWNTYVVWALLLLSLIIVLSKSPSSAKTSTESFISSYYPFSNQLSTSLASPISSTSYSSSLTGQYSQIDANSTSFLRPNNLSKLLQSTTQFARKSGDLSSFRTYPPKILSEESFEFLVFIIKNTSNSSNIPSSSATSISSMDPLDISTMPKSLVVAAISPYHTLTLNKFNVIPNHAMVITNTFEEQSHGLLPRDFDAWYYTVDSIGAIGFYNSDLIAGASQKHKHMQLIPLNEIYKLRSTGLYKGDVSDPLPLNSVIYQAKKIYSWQKMTTIGETNRIYKLPQFEFEHSIALLMTSSSFRNPKDNISYYGDYLYLVYKQLLVSLHITCKDVSITLAMESSCSFDGNSFNILLTSDWMFLVKRKAVNQDLSSVRLNGISFAGILLVTSEQAYETIRMMGGLQLLKQSSIE